MSIALLMPKAGLTNTEGTIVAWRADEGVRINKSEVVAEVETEKSTLDFVSPGDGILHIVHPAGTEIEVGGVMGYLAADRAEYEAMLAPQTTETPAAAAIPEKTAASAAEAFQAPSVPAKNSHDETSRVYATPLARKLCKNAGADIALIAGTGPGGRVLRKDVELHLVSRQPRAAATSVCEGLREPMSSIRKITAARMQESLKTMAQTTTMTELDVTGLAYLRSKLLSKTEYLGVRVSYTDLLAMATIQMLKKYPLANACLDDNDIVSYPYINLGVATATDYGLVVPVIKDADLLKLTGLSLAIKAAVGRARDKKSSPEDLADGTFTISNMGIFDVDMFTPIVNPPQTAILGFGRIVEKPAAYMGEIKLRSMMWASLTYDHRVFDGAYAGKIMGCLKRLLENPELIFIAD